MPAAIQRPATLVRVAAERRLLAAAHGRNPITGNPQPDQVISHRRDAAVTEHQAKHGGENVYEDRNLELTSMAEISVEGQIQGVRKALSAGPRRGSGARRENGVNP